MTALEQSLLSKIRALTPEQMAEVDEYVEFLASRSRRLAALNRILAIAPALEAAGVTPSSEQEIDDTVRAARAERRVRQQSQLDRS